MGPTSGYQGRSERGSWRGARRYFVRVMDDNILVRWGNVREFELPGFFLRGVLWKFDLKNLRLRDLLVEQGYRLRINWYQPAK